MLVKEYTDWAFEDDAIVLTWGLLLIVVRTWW